MARNVNVTITNWRLGTNVTIARRLVDVNVDYTDNAGVSRNISGTVTFPDILSLLSPEDLQEFATDIMFRAYRKTQNFDPFNGGVA